MRHAVKVALVAAMAFLIPGCGAIKEKLDAIPDDQLAQSIQMAATAIVSRGLALAAGKTLEKKAEVLADAKVAESIMVADILPAISGKDLGSLTVQVAQDILGRLSNKISPTIVAAIQLAITALTAEIAFPSNPLAQLPPRTLKALQGLFAGVEAGLTAFIAQAMAPPLVTARSAPEKLSWPVK